MTEVLLGDALVFILFLIFSSKGLNVLRVITGYPVDPGLHSVRWLAVYHGGTAAQKKLLDGDRLRRDFLCLIVSLLLKYPCPPIV